jgi:hypothetical protein
LLVVVAELAYRDRAVRVFLRAGLSRRPCALLVWRALPVRKSAYTLLEDGHVRVDLFYASMRRKAGLRQRGRVGAVLGMLLCWTILIIGFHGLIKRIIVGPILVFEVTQAGFGIYVKYFMAGFLGSVRHLTMMIQFVASSLTPWPICAVNRGHRETHSEMM